LWLGSLECQTYTPADVVVSATPVDITRLVKVNKPVVRVYYELQEIGTPTLEDVITEFLKKKGLI